MRPRAGARDHIHACLSMQLAIDHCNYISHYFIIDFYSDVYAQPSKVFRNNT